MFYLKKITKVMAIGLMLSLTYANAFDLGIGTSKTFEQNGIKKGDKRLSIMLEQLFPKGDDTSLTAYGTYGYFLNKKIEAIISLSLSKNGASADADSLFYGANIGANYYFYQSPILSQYYGGSIGTYGKVTDFVSNLFDTDAYWQEIHIGAHRFFSEDISLTAEAQADFYDVFTEYSGIELHAYFTFFF